MNEVDSQNCSLPYSISNDRLTYNFDSLSEELKLLLLKNLANIRLLYKTVEGDQGSHVDVLLTDKEGDEYRFFILN